MKFKIKIQYYLQNISVLFIGALLLGFVKFDWLVKVIIIQFLIFAIVELLNLACYYYVDDSGATLYNICGKKHIKWSDVHGIMKNSINNNYVQVILIDTNSYIKINSKVKNFPMLIELINGIVDKYKITTETALLTKELRMLYGSYLYSFGFSMILTSLSVAIALIAQILTFSDLIAISSVVKISLIFLISNMIAIMFMQQKI